MSSQTVGYAPGHIPRRCNYCGVRLTRHGTNKPTAATVDHIIPRSRGGSNGSENRIPCCLLCNRKKGSLMPHEFRPLITQKEKPDGK